MTNDRSQIDSHVFYPKNSEHKSDSGKAGALMYFQGGGYAVGISMSSRTYLRSLAEELQARPKASETDWLQSTNLKTNWKNKAMINRLQEFIRPYSGRGKQCAATALPDVPRQEEHCSSDCLPSKRDWHSAYRQCLRTTQTTASGTMACIRSFEMCWS